MYYISGKGPISCVDVVVVKEGSPASSIFNMCSQPPTHTRWLSPSCKNSCSSPVPCSDWTLSNHRVPFVTSQRGDRQDRFSAHARTRDVQVPIERHTFVHQMGHLQIPLLSTGQKTLNALLTQCASFPGGRSE